MTGSAAVLPHRWRDAVAIAAVALAAFASTAYFFGQMRHAQISLVDDHEILRFLGPDHRLLVWEIPALLGATEVGEFGAAGRFRPVYYTLRMLEASLFGDSAALWYLARMGMLAFIAATFGTLTYLAVRRRVASWWGAVLAAVTGAIVAFTVVTLPSTPDIVTRLGPSEIYVGVAVALLAVGMVRAWRAPQSLSGWILTAIAIMLAVGSKEDAILLVVPVGVLVVLRFSAVTRRGWVAGVLGTAFVVVTVVAAALLRGNASNSSDIYGQSRSVNGFLEVIPGNSALLMVVLSMICALACALRASEDPANRPEGAWRLVRLRDWLLSRPLLIVTFASLWLVLGEAFFYQNYILPSGFLYGRYGFLTELATLVAVTSAVVALVAVVRERSRTDRLVSFGLAAAFLIVSPYGVQYATAMSDYRILAAGAAAKTNYVHTAIMSGVASLEAHPDAQALIIAQGALDYERVYSLAEHLAFYADRPQSFLRVDAEPGQADSPFSADLVEQLVDMAKTGNLDEGWRIAPASERESDRFTVCFSFETAPEDTGGCDVVSVVG